MTLRSVHLSTSCIYPLHLILLPAPIATPFMRTRVATRTVLRAMSNKHIQETTMSRPQSIDKGKGKADGPISPYHEPGRTEEPLNMALEDAITTSLSPVSISSSLESDFHSSSPIAAPPRAHHSTPLRPKPPRLLSQLTRATLPTSTSQYASRDRRVTHHGYPSQGESSQAWRTSATTALNDEPFPDLDPTTGLPIAQRRGSASSDAPSLHLQRTITDLLQSPVKEPASFLPFNFAIPRVQIPGLPGRASVDSETRSISTSASQQDWSTWASSWWSGNKKKVDSQLAEEDQADTVEEEVENVRRKYRTPKNPIVFCHGLLGFDYLGPSSLPPLQISHWRGIREVLEQNGVEVLMTRVPATSSIKERAQMLEETIAEKFGGREVNLVGHSMGGLDCRYLVSELRPKAFKPISLTTVSTPHRGSPFADYLIDNVIGRERLPSLLSLLETMRLPQSGDGTAFEALGTKAMKEFNSTVVNRDDVDYFSWGASFEPGLLDTFRWPHSVILAKEGPNDGLVSVESAKWGEYRGTLLGVNHLDLVGWVNQVRYALSGWTGNPITFKPATFYLEISDYLAEQGH